MSTNVREIISKFFKDVDGLIATPRELVEGRKCEKCGEEYEITHAMNGYKSLKCEKCDVWLLVKMWIVDGEWV